MDWMLMPLRRYAEFSGRSQRKEYWMYFLFLIIVSIVTGMIDGILGLNTMIAGVYGPFTALLLLGTLIPNIAVAVRRLHDTDRSGWLLIAFVPIIGAIVLLVFYVTDGTRGPNRFGPDPKDPGQVEAFA